MAIRPYHGVLFDFDGTLVDTMPLHYEAYRRVFAEMQLELTPEDFYRNIGGLAVETIPKFLRGRPAPFGIDQIHRMKKNVLRQVLAETELMPLPASYLIGLLEGRVPLAIASSGSRPGIETILKRLGWEKAFQAVVTAEDVRRGKPAPEVFETAAALIGIPPADCLAFEDTDDGISAARAAGCQVIDVRNMAASSTRLV
jgi:beta-phosphoglucomutase-like phosphatase (HAD superfamily)